MLAFSPVIAAKNRLGQLKLGGSLDGEQFNTLTEWVDSPRLPEDVRLYLEDHLTAGQFVSLVQSGAIPKVPASGKTDPRKGCRPAPDENGSAKWDSALSMTGVGKYPGPQRPGMPLPPQTWSRLFSPP